jgi:aspartyl-tRNA(Asn)/glutamyl-tRNA(Gln) amidotransferase subunit C
MTITPEDVHRIAHLARIEITAGDAADVRAKLDAIFGLIDELQAIDTRGVAPMAHAQDVAAALREDRVTEADQHALYQGVAPAVEDGLYLVPRVIE